MSVTIVGNNTPTAGGVVYGDGTNYASTAAGTSGQLLTSAGSGTPVWGAISYSTSTGTLNVPAPASNSAGITLNGSGSTPPVAVTFSATVMTLDCTRSNVFTTTFTASVTTAPTISNPQDGQTINWFLTQDVSGSRTMTWPTSFKWPSASPAVLSTSANAVDLLVASYRPATGFWYVTLTKAFG